MATLLIRRIDTSIIVIIGYAYEDLSGKPRPNVSAMRQSQDDLLIVYALSLLAWEYRGMEKEEWALDLAAEIADQHGLKVSDAIHQLE